MNQEESLQFYKLYKETAENLLFIDSIESLAEKTSEQISRLPEVSRVIVSFDPQINISTKLGEYSIVSPIKFQNSTFGYIGLQTNNTNIKNGEIVQFIETISNLVAGIYFKIKQTNEFRILSNIAKETDYAIILSDFTGNIEWVNEGFVTLSGFVLEDVKGKHLEELFQVPNKNTENKDAIINAIKTHSGIKLETANYTKSGEKYWVYIELKPIYEKERITHFVLIQKNITKLKCVEKELKSTKEMAESANEAKNRFLAITSHEIRTPLNIILGMSKILLETNTTEIQQKYIRGIKSSSQNLLLIINDLLDISKIQAGKLQLENIEFDLHQIAEDALTFQNIKAKEKGLALRLIKDENICNSLQGDPFRLNQILLNLLTNAIKFTEKGSVELSYKLISESESEQTVEFMVTDTGIGIDSKKLDKIFDSYTQEDIAITRKYGGTGLGLTITKELVDLLQGTISVESDKNKGSIFKLVFSFKRYFQNMEKESEYNVNQAGNSLHGIKVLMAEDNEFNQIIALAYLSRWGIATDVAKNGLEAITLIKSNIYDIVLMDIQMPEMDGITATNIIRNELKLDIPIIALTAHALNYEREEFMKNGLNDYLTKPIDEALLYKSISRYAIKSSHLFPNRQTVLPMIDSTKLYDLSDLKKISVSDKLFIPKIIELFIKQSGDIPHRLNELIEKKDFNEIAFTIHQIKPSLNHLSVNKALEMILIIEDNIHFEKNHEETITIIKQLIELLEELFIQLKEELKEQNRR